MTVALLAATAFAVSLAAGPSRAAAQGLQTGFIDQGLFVHSDPSTQATWLNRAVGEGASVVRIGAVWSNEVGDHPPASPANPADPDYNFSALDAAVTAATARHLEVFFTVNSAPAWAEGPNRPKSAPAGTWKPDPGALGKFGQALAKRYSGSFGGLPRVRYFELWNEPNLSIDLTPQWEGTKAESPEIYRQMLNAFYTGVHRGQPGAQVIAGATAPFGDPRTKPRNPRLPRMRPLTFLRQLLCLNVQLTATKCPAKPHLNVLSHHPINLLNPPGYRAINANDVEVADFHKVRAVLNAAERAKTIVPAGDHPLWATELGWYTNPPSSFGVPVAKEARWVEQSLYLLWKQGADVAVNFLIRDRNTQSKTATTSGVFFTNDQPKPSATSFRFPFVGDRKSKNKVRVWCKAPASGRLKIQRAHGKAWRTVKQVRVHRGNVVTRTIRLRSKAKLRGQVGNTTSLVWHQR
jgi:hypothetical protein